MAIKTECACQFLCILYITQLSVSDNQIAVETVIVRKENSVMTHMVHKAVMFVHFKQTLAYCIVCIV